MRHLRTFLLVLASVFALSPVSVEAAPDRRSPHQIIQRGVKELSRAVALVLADKPASVAFVFDVTPNVRRARRVIEKALQQPGLVGGTRAPEWRIAALGKPLSKPMKSGAHVAREVAGLLRTDTAEINTMGALARSLKGYARRHAHIVFVTDWHFEDDFELEALIKRLKRRHQKLSVIGSEAAWGQPWVEPFYPRVKRDPSQQYTDNVGRSPFGGGSAYAPWHAGDTAYPHVPWHVDRLGSWTHAFPLFVGDLEKEQEGESTGDDPEDLADRESDAPQQPAVAWKYPVPSSWGPYGLMRLAKETGGRYVLFSFNPSGRRNVTYIYSKCNHLAPDLRSRKEILRDAKRGRYQRAMTEAWNLLGTVDRSVFKITSPLSDEGFPDVMSYAQDRGCYCTAWETREAHDVFVRSNRLDLKAIEEAHKILTKALRGQGPSRTDAEHMTRYYADARYMQHVVHVMQFQTKEALLAAEAVPASAWEDPEVFPALYPRPWLIPIDNTEERVRPVKRVTPMNPDGAETLVRRTHAFLEKYGGTPSGEVVAKNTVSTFQVHLFSRAYGSTKPSRSTGTPSESDQKAPETPRRPVRPRGGAGSGGGATTGG